MVRRERSGWSFFLGGRERGDRVRRGFREDGCVLGGFKEGFFLV